MAITQAQIDALKKQYKTVDEVKSNKFFQGASADTQKQILSYYSPQNPVPTVPVNSPTTTIATTAPTQPTGGIQDLGNGKFKLGSQTFTSMEAAQKAQARIAGNPTLAPTQNPVTTTPATPTTPVAPTTPPPAEPVVPPAPTDTTAKQNEPNYQDNSPERLAQIQQNLTQYAQTNPNLFTNPDTFKNFFSYDQRSEEQKAILDSFFGAQQQQQIDTQITNARFSQLQNMTDNELMGDLSQEDIMLIGQDPALQARYAVAKEKKSILDFVYGEKPAEVPPLPDGLDGVAGNLPQEITDASVAYANSKAELDNLQQQMENTYTDLVAQYEGTGASDSYIRAKANKINESLSKEYNSKVRAANLQLETYNALSGEYKMQQEEIKQQKQQEQDNMTQRMQLYALTYGTFGERIKLQESSITEDKNIGKTIDIGTSKNPKIMQWNPETQKYDIPVSGGTSGVGTGGKGGVGGGISITSTQQAQRKEIYKSIQGIVNAMKDPSWRIKLASGLGNAASDLALLRNNLTLDKFIETKKQGATYGALSDSEWDIISSSASRLGKAYSLSDDKLLDELNTISIKFGGKPVTKPASSGLGGVTGSIGIVVGDPTLSRLK